MHRGVPHHRLDTTCRVPRNLVDAAERQRLEMPRWRPMGNQVSSTRKCHCPQSWLVVVNAKAKHTESWGTARKASREASATEQHSHHGRGNRVKAKTFAESRTLSKSTEATKRQVTKPSATNYVR